MSNIIDSIKLSGTVYTLSAQTSGGGNPTVELTQAEYDALVTAGTVAQDTYYIITDAQAGDLTNYYTKTETNTLLGGKADTATTYTKTEVDNAITAGTSTKQDTLVSGTNIKTINNTSLLGSGNIDIQGGSGGKAVSGGTNISVTTGTTADTINCTLPIREGSNSSGKGIIIGDSECSASGNYGIAIGHNADASGGYSFAMGSNSNTTNSHSLAFGNGCQPKGNYSVMFGSGSISNSTKSDFQYYFGQNLRFSNHSYEIAFGLNNSTSHGSTTFGDSGNTLLSIGNGYDYQTTHNYHNAIEIRQNGDIYIPNTNDTSVTGNYAYSLYPMVKLQDYLQIKVVKLTQSAYDALSPNYDSNTLYIIKD